MLLGGGGGAKLGEVVPLYQPLYQQLHSQHALEFESENDEVVDNSKCSCLVGCLAFPDRACEAHVRTEGRGCPDMRRRDESRGAVLDWGEES